MFLKRLFGKSAAAPVPTSQPALIEIALGDPDVTARRDACRRLLDLGTLRRLAAEDTDAGVRDLAGARYQRLLCGLDEQAPALATRLSELAALTADETAATAPIQALLAEVARHSPAPEARATALSALQSEATLADCALADALAANRLLAAERLAGRAALEHVAKGAGKRDKGVYRLVRQRLKALTEAEARPLQARAEGTAICERLSRLGRFDNWTQDRAVLEHLDQQWLSIADTVEADLSERFTTLRQAFLDAFTAHAEANAARMAGQRASEQARVTAISDGERLVAALAELPRRFAGPQRPDHADPDHADDAHRPVAAADTGANGETGGEIGGETGGASVDTGSAAEPPADPPSTAPAGRTDDAPAATKPTDAADSDTEAPQPGTDPLAALDAALAEITTAWTRTMAAGAPPALARDYAAALTAAKAHREALIARRRDAQSAARLLADAQALLARGGAPGRKALRGLQRRAEALGIVGNAAPGSLRTAADGPVGAEPGAESSAEPSAGPRSELATILARLTRRFDKHQAQLHRKVADLPERLRALAAHIEGGELRKAEPLFQAVHAVLDQVRTGDLSAPDLGPQLQTAENELKRLGPMLKELRQWRRWSADEHREALCQEAEALAADHAQPLPNTALRLADLHQRWRELERTGAPASDEQRERFRGATDQLQARCQPYLQQQAARIAENRRAREALCVELETFLDQVDWSRLDWKRAARAEREMRQTWVALDEALALEGAMAPAGSSGRRAAPLEGRFRRALRRLDKVLADERERNQAQKRELIDRMQTLIEAPDLRRAVDSAKELQQQWQTTVPGHQREENQLWQAFRGASDAVFARRQAEHAAKDAELREHQHHRAAICEALTTVATDDEADAEALTTALRDARQRWQDSESLPLPRAAASALDQQWRAALDQAEARLAAMQAAARQAASARLAAATDYCDRIAREVVSTPETLAAAQVREAFAELLAPDEQDSTADRPGGDWRRTLQATFDDILTASTDATARTALAERLTANRERRETLCLQLEITVGIDSPAALREQRMQLQVERLRERIGVGAADPLADADALLADWTRSTPAAASPALDSRLARIRAALERTGSDPAHGDPPVSV